jgi:hypothetical protein
MPAEPLHDHNGGLARLARLPLVCRCGSAKLRRYLLDTSEEATLFLANGAPPESAAEGRAAFVS